MGEEVKKKSSQTFFSGYKDILLIIECPDDELNENFV